MSSIKKVILGLFLVLFITGCMEVIEIEGNKEIKTNESHTYKAIIVSTKYQDMDSYIWKVISKNKDYHLTNETTSEVTFKASSAGKYTLKVIAKKNRKPFKATMEVIVTKAEIINGYELPPEPDEALNNSTLLGIDSNDNGVRDDVEIFVIKKYATDHKIVTEIGFQLASAYQKILDNPLDTEANHKALHDAMDCNYYFSYYAKYYGESILAKDYIDEDFENLQLNRKSRVKAYLEYDAQLSGGVYESTKSDKLKEKCNFDVASLLGGN
ncbi:PKD domain-containing protein [Sulfurimonas sp.]|uniref:PKD domain-containing protein n=1 Tax=Sulfurimonas sp. TaxID=2022749 RepID=UPI002B4A60BB|nr:hypothetical protein [Sulfurimonas sp.]